MLKLISWKEFIEAMLILATIYYLIVLLIYYRRELMAMIRGRFLAEELSQRDPPEQNPSLLKEPDR